MEIFEIVLFAVIFVMLLCICILVDQLQRRIAALETNIPMSERVF